MQRGGRPHFVLVLAPREVVFDGVGRWDACDVARSHLVDGDLGRVGLGGDPCCEEGLDQRCHEGALGIPAQLKQRLDDRSQIRDTPVLVGTLAVHDLQYVGQAGLFAVGDHAGPFLHLGGDLPGINVADVIGHYPPVSVHLHAVVDRVSRSILAVRNLSFGVASHRHAAAVLGRRADAVGLDDVQTQGIRIEGRWLYPLDQHKHIARHEPGFQGELLQPLEIVHPDGVAVLMLGRPKPELGLGLALPLLGCFGCKAQNLPVDGRF